MKKPKQSADQTGRRTLCLLIPSLQLGGMERVMTELAGYFCKKDNIDVHLVLYGRSIKLFYEVPKEIIIHRPDSGFNDSLRFLSTVRRLYFLRMSVKKINPDSVLSFGEYWNSFVLLALLNLPYSVFISDRCSPAKKFDFKHTLLRKYLYPKAKGIIAQTDYAKYLYNQQFSHSNICVIGNPIRFVVSDKTKKEKIVLNIGRLIKSKNQDRLIEIFCHINRPDWTLVIVGGDALKQNNMTRLQNLVKSSRTTSKIILEGPQYELERFYQVSSIFAFTSDSEGFPNVIGEALSAGLPVVSYDCVAGPSEMITDGENGFLIPVFEDDKLQAKLTLLMDNEPLLEKMSQNAKESIQKFSIESIGQKYLQFILR